MSSFDDGGYAPNMEPALMLSNDRTNLEGLALQGIAYGAHLLVFCLAAAALLRPGAMVTHASPRRRAALLVYIFVMFSIGTFMLGANINVCVEMYVNNRTYDGGPSAWISDNYSMVANQFGNAAFVVGNFLADSVLLYRTFLVWNRNYLVIAFPALLFCASTAMSFLTMYEISQPLASLWTTLSTSVALVYFSLAITLNLLLTLLISVRLYMMSKYVREALGAAHAHAYTSVAAIVAESAFPYSLTGFVFIITFGLNSPSQNLFLPILGQVMCLAPELIIYRVATGRAWGASTTGLAPGAVPHTHAGGDRDAPEMSRMQFASAHTTAGASGTTRVPTGITEEKDSIST